MLIGALELLNVLPVLLVFDAADRYTSPNRSIPRFAEAFPNHDIVIIRGAGHFFRERAPEHLTNAIRQWLDQNPARRSRPATQLSVSELGWDSVADRVVA